VHKACEKEKYLQAFQPYEKLSSKVSVSDEAMKVFD